MHLIQKIAPPNILKSLQFIFVSFIVCIYVLRKKVPFNSKSELFRRSTIQHVGLVDWTASPTVKKEKGVEPLV